MVSTLAWLDHDEGQQKRMLEVVRLFREQGTVDELGIGSVRNALSETLFPGISVLHTRARYLLFVSWICRGIERDRVPSARAGEELRTRELLLIEALVAGGEDRGVIGIAARERLKQTPSMAYWSAVYRYGIRTRPGSRSQWARSLDGHYRRLARITRDDEAQAVGGVPRNWHAGLPEPPDGFLEATTHDLRPAEADYLAERLLGAAPGTYLAHLLSSGDADVEADLPWAHPAAATAPDRIREHILHARNFSEVIHGAALLYNLVLAEQVGQARAAGGEPAVEEDLTENYRTRLGEWRAIIQTRLGDLDGWNRGRFWQTVLDATPRVPSPTRVFVDRWLDLAVAQGGEVADDPEARRLIVNREIAVKGALARVANTRALERWSGFSGVDQLTYRWGSVLPVVTDIAAGLRTGVEVGDAGA